MARPNAREIIFDPELEKQEQNVPARFNKKRG